MRDEQDAIRQCVAFQNVQDLLHTHTANLVVIDKQCSGLLEGWNSLDQLPNQEPSLAFAAPPKLGFKSKGSCCSIVIAPLTIHCRHNPDLKIQLVAKLRQSRQRLRTTKTLHPRYQHRTRISSSCHWSAHTTSTPPSQCHASPSPSSAFSPSPRP